MIVTTLGGQGELAAVNSHTRVPLIYSDLVRPWQDKKTDRPILTGTLRIRQNSNTAVPLIYSD